MRRQVAVGVALGLCALLLPAALRWLAAWAEAPLAAPAAAKDTVRVATYNLWNVFFQPRVRLRHIAAQVCACLSLCLYVYVEPARVLTHGARRFEQSDRMRWHCKRPWPMRTAGGRPSRRHGAPPLCRRAALLTVWVHSCRPICPSTAGRSSCQRRTRRSSGAGRGSLYSRATHWSATAAAT
jgi:hypothetical protein